MTDVATDESVNPPSEEGARPPLLVPRTVSANKLARELDDWSHNAEAYRRRGWVLLGVAGLTVDVGFLSNVAVGDMQVPAMTASIRLEYDNYDLWPPSLTFIDPRSGTPVAPIVQSLERISPAEVRNTLLVHPVLSRHFLCLPGTREYHSHPQHTGDDWLLHRSAGEGRLAVVCDRVWRRMSRNVFGFRLELQSLPGMGTQLGISLAQGDIEELPASA